MMFPERMLHADIAVPLDRVQSVMTALHENGIMDVEEHEGGDAPGLHRRLVETRRSIGILVNASRRTPASKGEAIRSIMVPEPIVPSKGVIRSPEDVLETGLATVDEFGWALEARARLTELRTRRREMREGLRAIGPVLGAPVRLSDVGERHGYGLYFVRPGEDMPEEAVWTTPDGDVALVAVTDRTRLTTFERLEFPPVPAFPSDHAITLEDRIGSIGAEITRLTDELSALEPEHKSFRVLREHLSNAAHQVDALRSLRTGRYTAEISGWVSERDAARLERVIARASGGLGHVVLDRREEYPTKLRNPRWAEPFSGIVSLYGTPSRNEIDPTILTTITFILTFGLMLGDLGYGLIIMVLSLYGMFVIGRASPVVRGASVLGIELGAATMTIGFLTGSFFGDLHQSIWGWKELYHLEIGGLVLPFDVLNNVNMFILTAIMVGVVMLYGSVFLGAINDVRRGDRRSLVLKKVSWIVLLPAGIIQITIFIFDFSYSPMVETISLGLVIAMVGLIFIDVTLFFIFEITGMLGDILSFVRIMALGLATLLLASAVNAFVTTIGAMLPAGAAILLVGLLIVAHLGNMGLQALGSGVHSLRLQFVEFYRRFYEGDGTPFEPFHAQRLYTEIEIEEG